MTRQGFQLLNGEISGDAAFETIRHMTQFHRPGNSPGFTAAADYPARMAREFGLVDVVRLKQPQGHRPGTPRRGRSGSPVPL